MRRTNVLALAIVVSFAALADKSAKGLPTAVVNRLTGNIAIQNQTGSAEYLTGYSLMSAAGSINVSVGGWDPISPSNGWTIHSQTEYEVAEYGAPHVLSPGATIDVGKAWTRSTIEDLFFQAKLIGATMMAGVVQYVGLPGDYNDDGRVGAADYVVWRKHVGLNALLPNDSIGGTIGVNQYGLWRANFQGLPGPSISLVTNLDQPTNAVLSANGNAWAAASSFTTASGTHVLDSITVAATSDSSGTSELRIHADNAGGPGTPLVSLGSQAITGLTEVTYNSGPNSLVLQPFTKYWVTLGETGSGDVGWNATLSSSETSALGWTIGDLVYQKQAGTNTWQNFGPPNYAGLFAVTAHAQSSLASAAVPEPTAVTLLIFTAAGMSLGSRMKR